MLKFHHISAAFRGSEERYPNVAAYYKKLRDRPSIKKTWPPTWIDGPGMGTLKDIWNASPFLFPTTPSLCVFQNLSAYRLTNFDLCCEQNKWEQNVNILVCFWVISFKKKETLKRAVLMSDGFKQSSKILLLCYFKGWLKSFVYIFLWNEDLS